MQRPGGDEGGENCSGNGPFIDGDGSKPNYSYILLRCFGEEPSINQLCCGT